MAHQETIETITGPKSSSELGKILPHEHLMADFSNFYVPPPENVSKYLSDDYISLENSRYIEKYPYSNKFNLIMNDEAAHNAITRSVMNYCQVNQGLICSENFTILENTSYEFGKRDVAALFSLCKEIKNLNIIIGTGYYTTKHNPLIVNMTEENIYDAMYHELEIGHESYIKDHTIKAGFIGEVSCGWPTDYFDRSNIQAVGRLQAQLNCPVAFHTVMDMKTAFEVLRLYQEAGGKSSKASFCNLQIIEGMNCDFLLYHTDCYLQINVGVHELSWYEERVKPTDAHRMLYISKLKRGNQLHRLLLSHDIHTKDRLMGFGGYGYTYIEDSFLPIMLLKEYITVEDIKLILRENPKNWLFSR